MCNIKRSLKSVKKMRWVLLFSFIDILRAPTPFLPETPPYKKFRPPQKNYL